MTLPPLFDQKRGSIMIQDNLISRMLIDDEQPQIEKDIKIKKNNSIIPYNRRTTHKKKREKISVVKRRTLHTDSIEEEEEDAPEEKNE